MIEPLLTGDLLKKGMTVRIARSDSNASDADQWIQILSSPAFMWRIEEVDKEIISTKDVIFFGVWEDSSSQTLCYDVGVRWERKL